MPFFKTVQFVLIGKFISRCSALLTKKIVLFHIFLSTIPSLMIPAINFHLCSKTFRAISPEIADPISSLFPLSRQSIP